MKKTIGIVNFHSSPEISPLTDNRPLGSTSFLGRYALCDIALSNLCNSGIDTVGLLVKDHQRSILKHLGSMDAWVSNTKIGQEIIMYNEPAHLNPELNTDLNNIKENDWVLYDSTASYIIIVPAHIITLIDCRKALEEHIRRHEKITVFGKPIADPSKEFLCENIIEMTKDGYASTAYPNPGTSRKPAIVSMGAYIINRTVLADMTHRFLPANPTLDLKTLIYQAAEEGEYQVHVQLYDGYARCVDSFKTYMDISFELLEEKNAVQLFKRDWPIYTQSHDTPPSVYGENSIVANSFIANGAMIEGTVINSIIARGVKVAKGAVVRDSIIFSSTKIGEGAQVEHALVDKYSIITRNKKVIGKKKDPVYLHQGAIL